MQYTAIKEWSYKDKRALQDTDNCSVNEIKDILESQSDFEKQLDEYKVYDSLYYILRVSLT